MPSPLDTYLGLRPRLFGIAYRMTGSHAESEDLLQDTWLRWQSADHNSIADPTAFLVTITSSPPTPAAKPTSAPGSPNPSTQPPAPSTRSNNPSPLSSPCCSCSRI